MFSDTSEQLRILPDAELDGRVMRQGLRAGRAQAIRQLALDQVGGDGSVPVDGKLVVVAVGSLLRIGVGAKHGAIQNLSGIVCGQRIIGRLAGGQDLLRQGIVGSGGHERLPLLAGLHGSLLSGREFDGLDPGLSERHVFLLEGARLRRVGDDRAAVRCICGGDEN